MKINELKEGLSLDGLNCYIGSITERVTKTGKPYVSVVFKDETGEIGANVWDTSKDAWDFKTNDVVSLIGTVGAFAGKLQANTRSIVACLLPLENFFRCSERNIEEMFNELVDKHIVEIKDPFIKYLADELIMDSRFMDIYCKAPAAKGVHHNWIGGLVEHVLGMSNMAKATYQVHYQRYLPTLNMDKVIFGCIFHDWGKMLEYGFDTPNITYTKRGCLQHHMGIVSEALVRKAVDYEMSIKGEYSAEKAVLEITRMREVLHELLHIIYSHHGKPDWGSPVRPATAEALFVHLIDYIDGNMIHMREQIKDHKEGDIPGMSARSWVHQAQYMFLPKEEGF